MSRHSQGNLGNLFSTRRRRSVGVPHTSTREFPRDISECNTYSPHYALLQNNGELIEPLMSLYGDITSDLKGNWRNSTLPTRCLLILSLFFTISSVASLSDTVFQWKGFILDGVEFYRHYVRQPILVPLDFLGLKLHEFQLDSILAISISMGPVVLGPSEEPHAIRWLRILGVFVALVGLPVVLAQSAFYLEKSSFLFDGRFNPTGAWQWVAFVVGRVLHLFGTYYVAGLAAFAVFIYFVSLSDQPTRAREGIRLALPLAAFVSVFLLAAINVGLTR